MYDPEHELKVQIGDIFAIKLDSIDKYGLFQVIQKSPFVDKKNPERVVVASFDWYGDSIPHINNFKSKIPFLGFLKKLPPILKLNRFDYRNHKAIVDLPNIYRDAKKYGVEIKKIGFLQCSYPEVKVVGLSFSSIRNLKVSLEYEWRWRCDRKALVEEVEASQKESEEIRLNEEKKLIRELKLKKIDDLLDENKFKGWERYQGKDIAQKATLIWNDGIRQMMKVKKIRKVLENKVSLEIIESMLKKYNQLNDEYQDAFETEEREDLYEAFRRSGIVIGIEEKTLKQLFNKIRTW